MNNRRHVMLGLGLAAWLVGCRAPISPLRVAYHAWPGYAPLHLVHTLGWIAPERVQFYQTASASGSLQALKDGHVQAAGLTLDEVLQARAQELPLQVVALLDISAGADVVLGRRPLPDVKSLRGLRIGHEPGSVGELMVVSWLQTIGLDYQEIRPVHVPFDMQEMAWRAGEIDALVTFEPLASRLAHLGAVRWYDSRQLPEGTEIADVLAVHEGALSQYGGHIEELLKTLFLALHHLNTLTLDSQYRLAPWLSVPLNQVSAAFKGLRLVSWAENREQLLVGTPPPLGQTAARLARLMEQEKIVPHPIALDNLINGRFLSLEAPL